MTRLFDIFFSSLAIVILSPLLIPIMVALRFSGEGKIFYLQERVGRFGRLFRIYKFATMLEDSPNIGTGTITVKDDPRVLPLGKILRKTKINELPQLLNILFGDMSIIGPRPVTQRGFDAYSKEDQNAIKQMRPGLSGIGSIIFRDEENLMHLSEDPEKFYDTVIAPYKGSLEQWYSSRRGVGTYLALIFLTVWAVVFSKSNLVWALFSDLPTPEEELRKKLQC